MQHTSMKIEEIHIPRVDPGEDLLACIERFVQETNLEQAVVLGGYGTLAAYHLHWVIENRIPSQSTYGRGFGHLCPNSDETTATGHVHLPLDFLLSF